jgi:hypothetical protein
MNRPYEKAAVEQVFQAAFDLILRVPGYPHTGKILTALYQAGDIRFDSTLEDRATTDWRGIITVGPEAVDSGRVGLAETLVHEQFHRTQPVYTKTISFWSGIATKTPVWRRLELPAYRAALDFLKALEVYAQQQQDPELVAEAQREQFAVTASFRAFYGDGLV